MKAYIARPSRVVNLKTITPASTQIAAGPSDSLKIGATVTIYRGGKKTPTINPSSPASPKPLPRIATPQIRNLGTVGGNLCQRPRCWYFRLENYQCLKKGGTECFAATGENKYNAIFGGGPRLLRPPAPTSPPCSSPPSTPPSPSPAPPGTRDLPLENFFTGPHTALRKENILTDGEIVTQVTLPNTPLAARSTYLKFKERESLDFAISAVALPPSTSPPDKSVRDIRLVLRRRDAIPATLARPQRRKIPHQGKNSTSPPSPTKPPPSPSKATQTPRTQRLQNPPHLQTLVRRAPNKTQRLKHGCHESGDSSVSASCLRDSTIQKSVPHHTGGSQIRQPQQTDETLPQTPFCGELRSKKYFLLDQLPTEAAHYLDSTRHCWCYHTQQPVGPDGQRVDPSELCTQLAPKITTAPPSPPRYNKQEDKRSLRHED